MKPFELIDIEDCKIIIKAKGKHYCIVPKEKENRDNCKIKRITAFLYLLKTHDIVDIPLEEINIKKLKTKVK